MNQVKNIWENAGKLVRYNMKVIFGSAFFYFVLAAFLVFLIIMLINVLNGNIPSESGMYSILLLPGMLMIFYPTAYGIQIDQDAKTLEILFGIPNYRYKVWLFRLVLTFLLEGLIVIFLVLLAHIAIVDIDILSMWYHLQYPFFFIGGLAFMFSTLSLNGNSAAFLTILTGLGWFFMVLFDVLPSGSEWNLFFNPLQTSGSASNMLWEETVLRNRLYLLTGILVTVLTGLNNLQKRERFMQ